MTTATITRTIGLWLDTQGSDTPMWVVSRDRRYEDGEVESSATVELFAADDRDSAEKTAMRLAKSIGLKLIETDRYGVKSELYDPSDEPVAVDVRSYASGDRLGTVDGAEPLGFYEAQAHPKYQWPEGIARAVSVLSAAQIEEIDIDPNTVVWLEEA